MIDQIRAHLASRTHAECPDPLKLDRSTALILGALLTLLEGQITMGSRLDALTAADAAMATALTDHLDAVDKEIAALAADVAALAAEPTDAEIATLQTDEGQCVQSRRRTSPMLRIA